MTFVNEYASDEDIEKYDLNGIWDQYHPAWKDDYYLGHKPKFTIDRKRNIFFMVIRQGRGDQSNRTTALLWINGQRVIFDLDMVGGLNQKRQKSDPYLIRWELADCHPQLGITERKETIIKILKEAQIAYGYMGVTKQLPNSKVEFNY